MTNVAGGATAVSPVVAEDREFPVRRLRHGTQQALQHLRAATPALLGYVAVRVSGLLVLGVWSARDGKSLFGQLGLRYDAGWLMGIAAHGYDHAWDGRSNLAFFPLFPAITRGLATLLPLSVPATGILVAWAFGVGAAWGLFALGRRIHDARTGTVLAVLWGVLPHAITQSMAYTEAPFTALVVWCLYALLARRWIAAGILCLLAGLIRPTAYSLIAVVLLATAVELVHSRGRNVHAWIATLLAPLGWSAYLLWVARVTGSLTGWFRVQGNGWGSTWDGGRWTLRFIYELLTHPASKSPDALLAFYVVTVIMAAAFMLLVIGALEHQPWQVWMFSAILFVTVLGDAAYYNSRARFLVPAVGLLIPPARALARAKPAICLVIVITLTVASSYYGGYLLMVSPISP